MTYGIDTTIESITNRLKTLVTWNDFNIYGRIYRNLRNDNYIPEKNLNGKEFKKIFIDDNCGGEMGFYVKNRSYQGFQYKSNTDVIFTVNKTKLGMIDEERIMLLAERWLLKTGYVVSVGEVKVYINNVFSDFYTDNIKYRDAYPFWVFSIECEINYTNNACK